MSHPTPLLFDPPCAGPGDHHAHVFERGISATSHPRYVPDYTASVDAYLDTLDRHQVAWGTLVQPSFLGTDNTVLLSALRRHPDRLRGVIVLDHDHPDADAAQFARWHETGVRGVRLNLIGHDVPDVSSAAWHGPLQAMSELGWHLELQLLAPTLRRLIPALDALPCRVVIDHLGRPDSVEVENHPLVELSERPHVWVKASAPYRSAPGAAAAMHAALVTRGFSRMVPGSDWPHTQFEHDHPGAWEYF